MSSVTTDRRSSGSQATRCPACGQPIVKLVRGRCALCNYQVEDEPVTADDTSPYTQCERPTRRDRCRMTRWMWTAGAGRLAHLSLMQASPASRQYARKDVNAIALTGMVCWLTLTGWHAARLLSVEAGGQAREPSGRGWLALANTPDQVPIAAGDPSRIVAWWWNPILAVSGAVTALVIGLGVGRILLSILRRGVERSLLPRYRGEQRLSAALYYCTAWSAPVIPAGLVLALSPVCDLAAVGDWPVKPPVIAPYFVAAVLGGAAVIMGWFGLTRLALTVPVRARTRVVLFCGLGMPVITASLVVGTVWGLWWIQNNLVSHWLQTQW